MGWVERAEGVGAFGFKRIRDGCVYQNFIFEKEADAVAYAPDDCVAVAVIYQGGVWIEFAG